MPEVSHSKLIPAGKARIWDYVQDMDNWAPFIMGYQSHEKHDERRSTWTVKGELGALARTVTFDVLITGWHEMQRVSFTITGVSETFEGEGSFRIGMNEQPEGTDFVGTRRRRGVLRSLFRRWFRRKAATSPTVVRADSADETAFSFVLSMHAGGMTGPVVNAMIEPLMAKAADDLAEKLTAEILGVGGANGKRTAT